jgi:hypothetical protein
MAQATGKHSAAQQIITQRARSGREGRDWHSPVEGLQLHTTSVHQPTGNMAQETEESMARTAKQHSVHDQYGRKHQCAGCLFAVCNLSMWNAHQQSMYTIHMGWAD